MATNEIYQPSSDEEIKMADQHDPKKGKNTILYHTNFINKIALIIILRGAGIPRVGAGLTKVMYSMQ